MDRIGELQQTSLASPPIEDGAQDRSQFSTLNRMQEDCANRRSPRNSFRNHPGIAFTFPRILQRFPHQYLASRNQTPMRLESLQSGIMA